MQMTRVKDQDGLRYDDTLSNYNLNVRQSLKPQCFTSRNNLLTRGSLAPQQAHLFYLALFYLRDFALEGLYILIYFGLCAYAWGRQF